MVCRIAVQVKADASDFQSMSMGDYERRYLDPAYRVARLLLRNDREAREVSATVVNLVLTRFAIGGFHHEEAFKDDDFLGAFLLKAVRNGAIDYLRHAKSKERRLQKFRSLKPAGEFLSWPNRRTKEEELLDLLNEAIQRLPSHLREVQTLKLNGLSCDEIAAIWARPVGTIKSWLSEAREKIKKHMLCRDSHLRKAQP